MAYPERRSEYAGIIEILDKAFQNLCTLKNSDPDTLKQEGYCTVGYPIVVYKRLDTTEWKQGDELLLLESENRSQIVQLFLSSVARACKLIEQAGIIHTDLRLYNIFYRVTTPSSDSDAIDAALVNASISAAGSGHPELSVSIKIIDWDDSVRINEAIPQELLDDRYEDLRFPQDPSFDVATAAYHEFFLESLKQELSSSSSSSNM